MATDDFAAFVRRENEQKVPSVDWEVKREQWVERLAQLYDDVADYLAEFTDSGAIDLRREPITLREEYLGTYEVDKLVLTIGARVIELRPIGTLLIGSAGRVDISGPRGVARLVLVDRKSDRPNITISIGSDAPKAKVDRIPDWTWKLATQPPSIRYTDLDQDSFREALLEVAGA